MRVNARAREWRRLSTKIDCWKVMQKIRWKSGRFRGSFVDSTPLDMLHPSFRSVTDTCQNFWWKNSQSQIRTNVIRYSRIHHKTMVLPFLMIKDWDLLQTDMLRLRQSGGHTLRLRDSSKWRHWTAPDTCWTDWRCRYYPFTLNCL